MDLKNRFLEKTEFSSYEDFSKNYKVKAPENFNYAYDVIEVMAKESPDQRALLWCNDKGEERLFTFKELDRYANKSANALKKIGIKKGDKVMLILKRHYQYWYTMMGLHKIGAVAIPATHLLTPKDIVYRVEQADVKLIITCNDEIMLKQINEAKNKIDIKYTATVNGEVDGFIDYDKAVEEADDKFARSENVNKSDDISIIYFTSGTTGMPKMVAHQFTYPLGHILTAGYWQNLKDTDLHLTAADSGWAKCSWGKMYGQWLCGACVFVYDYDNKFQPIDLAHKIEEYKITTFCAPPTIFRFLIKEDLSKVDLSSLRACYIAGEPLNPEVYKRWYDLTGIKLREGFGQTETVALIATYPWLDPKPGSTGKFSPSFNITLLDANGTPADLGQEGEICVDIRNGRPYGLYKEYYKDEEKTRASNHDGYYHTGDMAWLDEDGYVWFVGRDDDVIKSSGYRIGPFEVESALLEHKAVLETAITAVPDPVRGQIVKATVVLANGYEPSDELVKELQNYVKKVTAPYKYPRIIEFVKELPKTTSGKIRRGEIREKDSE